MFCKNCGETVYNTNAMGWRLVSQLLIRKCNNDELPEDVSRETMVDGLQELVGVMSSSGPFSNGTRIGAIDILLIPFAYRIDALLGHYRGFTLPSTGDLWSRYRYWYESMLETTVFKATSTDHDDYRQRLIEFYYPYSLGQGQEDVTETK